MTFGTADLRARRSGVPCPVRQAEGVRWEPGETIVHHEVWKGRVWAARPLTVVEDTDERLLLWIPHGTVRKVPMTPPTRPDPGDRTQRVLDLLSRGDWAHVDHVWEVSSLWILRPDDWHATWVSWLPTGEHFGWYVNLQYPFRRTPGGIEAMDLMLDVVADPDLSWRFKDDDEFAELLNRGIFDQDLGARVQAEADKVIGRIEAKSSPFDEPWPTWQAAEDWPRPVLPQEWDVVPVGGQR